MSRTYNTSARAAALDALAASAGDGPTAARLLAAPRLQPALAQWAATAEEDRQTSMLRALLAALRALCAAAGSMARGSAAQPRWDKALVRAVAKLGRCRFAGPYRVRGLAGNPVASGGSGAQPRWDKAVVHSGCSACKI